LHATVGGTGGDALGGVECTLDTFAEDGLDRVFLVILIAPLCRSRTSIQALPPGRGTMRRQSAENCSASGVITAYPLRSSRDHGIRSIAYSVPSSSSSSFPSWPASAIPSVRGMIRVVPSVRRWIVLCSLVCQMTAWSMAFIPVGRLRFRPPSRRSKTSCVA
jgi:hypothetical protein